MFLPAVDGTIPFESFVDFHLSHNPTETFAVFPQEPGQEALRVSFLEWCRAVHRVAHRLNPEGAAATGEVVALIANCDALLYTAILMGMIRAGLTPFPISPRNSGPAVCSMIEKTDCHRLVTTSQSLQSLLEATQTELSEKKFGIRIEEIPSLNDLFPHLGNEKSSDDFRLYPMLDKRAQDDVLFYIHSSGSTGFPKPIPQTVQTILDWCNQPPEMDIRGLDKHVVLGVMALPTFHTLGFTMQIMLPLITGKCIALFRPTYPHAPINASADITLEALRSTGSNGVIAVPSFYEYWSTSKEAVDYLSTVDFAVSSGGPLSTKVGDYLVSQGVKLVSLYGATEMGIPMSILPTAGGKEPQDWQYISISERSLPRWVPQDDGSYELEMLNTPTHHVSKLNLLDVEGYATSDLFVKHPTKDGLWKIVGRSDDVLILATGEKTVPGPIEGTILSHPFVQGAIMFGRERDQVGVLVEPKPQYVFDPSDHVALAAFRNSIWPVIEESNELAPAFSRIFKEMILVTSPWKPMARAPKGTVIRKTTLNEYAQEIESLYQTVEASAIADDIKLPESWTVPAIQSWLVALAGSLNHDRAPEIDVDLFAQGFDSLSATFLRNHIVGDLRSSGVASVKQAAVKVNPNIIFANPTIKQLAGKIASLVDPLAATTTTVDTTQGILDMIAKYSGTLPRPSEPKAVVLLTGSTGSLGCHLLLQLIQNENVSRVYAYNRQSNDTGLLDRQMDAFRDKGFDCAILEDSVKQSKVVFLEGVTARDNLGLEAAVYEELRQSCTHIIHNAWRLDFNLSLSSFEAHVAGTRNLLSLALTSPHSSCVRFLFTSSVAVLHNWDTDMGMVPEEGFLPPNVPGGGYGQGKYVAEQLILHAPIQSTSFRIGQITGGTPNGSWSLTDWVPIIIKSSVNLGCLPDSGGMVSWLPMHSVSQAILDTAFSPSSAPLPRTLHIVHPKPVKWTYVMEEVRKALVERGVVNTAEHRTHSDEAKDALPLVPFSEWVSLVRQRSLNAAAEDLVKIPAIKLLDFFDSIATGDLAAVTKGMKEYEIGNWARLQTTKAVEVSETMRSLAPIRKEDIRMWLDYWISKGLFEETS